MPRTIRGPDAVARRPLNMRVTTAIRDRLEAAAISEGRSLAQEAETRLEQSFRLDDVFGSEAARHAALLVGAAFGREARRDGLGRPTWKHDPNAYASCAAAAIQVLVAAIPGGDDHGLAIEALASRVLTLLATKRMQEQESAAPVPTAGEPIKAAAGSR
jgi:hypothetical protein